MFNAMESQKELHATRYKNFYKFIALNEEQSNIHNLEFSCEHLTFKIFCCILCYFLHECLLLFAMYYYKCLILGRI